MINPQAAAIAKKANMELVEYRPFPGEMFGPWWEIISVGDSHEYFWLWGNRAVPNGTVVKMTGGPLFLVNGLYLQPLG